MKLFHCFMLAARSKNSLAIKASSCPVIIPETRVIRRPGITSTSTQQPPRLPPRSESITMGRLRLEAASQSAAPSRSAVVMKRLRISGSRGKHAVLSSGIQSSRAAETVCGKSGRTKQQGRIGRTDTKAEKVSGEGGEYARSFGEIRGGPRQIKKGNVTKASEIRQKKRFCFIGFSENYTALKAESSLVIWTATEPDSDL